MRRHATQTTTAMRRRLRAAACAGLLALLGGLGSRQPASAAELSAAQRSDLDALTRATVAAGGDLDLRLDEASATPRYLSLRAAATGGGAPADEVRAAARRQAARAFLADYRRLLKVADPAQELALAREATDRQGLTHLRFRQQYRGIPVWAREVLVHLDAADAVYLVQGFHEPTPEGLDVAPAVTAGAAVLAAWAEVGAAPRPGAGAELGILPAAGGPRLAYRVVVEPGAGASWTSFVDARSGTVLRRLTNLRHGVAEGTGLDLRGEPQAFKVWEELGVYYLADPTVPVDEGAGNYDPPREGDLVVLDYLNSDGSGPVDYVTAPSPDGPWDPAGVSAMVNVAKTSAYFSSTFGLLGLDGQGRGITAVIHYREDPTKSYDNAFWSTSREIMAFGDGGATFLPTAGCFDVVAHELAHAVTGYRVDFVYRNQSGALSESYSDFFAAMVDREDWTIGEDCMADEDVPFLRDVAQPHRGTPRQPADMSEYLWVPATEAMDWGGVHYNSGIPNRAGYLVAERVGRERAEQIWFDSLDYLGAEATFADAALATERAAGVRFGAGSAAAAAVTAAWDAVQVFPPGRFADLGAVWGGEGGDDARNLGPGVDFGPCFVSAAGAASPAPLLLAVGLAALRVRRRG